ncbi:Menin [Trebouxia sp. C0009 RCD-2024]
MTEHDILSQLTALIKQELEAPDVNIALVSIALGAVETPLTKKDPAHQIWPANLMDEVDECMKIFENFVATINSQIAAKQLDLRAKVKLVADAVWSKLTGVFVNDVLHVQHVYVFTQHLKHGTKSSKRQLDCGGVVTTVLAICQRLAQEYGHADLAACRFQVSEDHCWLNTDPEGGREGTIEVTTDSPAKRALPVGAAAWQGWLYSGGHAPLCSHKMTIAAMVTSMNPSITARQNTGQDSEQVQHVQRHVLQMLQDEYPELMYPAALGCLADLHEIQTQDALEVAVAAGDRDKLQQVLQSDEAQRLFELAIARSLESGLGAQHQWYPYTYQFGHLSRRAEFLVRHAAQLLGQDTAWQQAEAAMTAAMQSIGANNGAAVLRQYRHMMTDEQLYKDIEGVLEQSCDMFKRQYQHSQQLICQSQQLSCLFECWDGICHMYMDEAKPSHWISQMLKALKWFTPEARAAAASNAATHSDLMSRAQALWAELKPPRIRALFEIADVGNSNGVASKRQRRTGTYRLE